MPLVALGCSSGQTGSPRCGLNESCVCKALDGKILLTGTLATLEHGSATVLVTGWVSPRELRDDLVLGDIVGGAASTGLGCEGDPPSEPAIGDEVFVAYERGSNDRYPECSEYRACTTAECGAPPTADDGGAWDVCDGQCVTDTRTACSAHRAEALVAGTLIILPKTEPQLLAGQQVTATDLAEFHVREVCESWFPPPPSGPCDDTVEMSSCSLSPRPTRSSSPVLCGLMLLVAFARLRRGERRRLRLGFVGGSRGFRTRCHAADSVQRRGGA